MPIPGVQSGLSGCILPRISPVRGAQQHTDITRVLLTVSYEVVKVQVLEGLRPEGFSFILKKRNARTESFPTAVSVQAFAEVY